MKIYKRAYDNPINLDGSKKPNELLGDFYVIQTIFIDSYSSKRIGTKDGRTYLIEEYEVSGFNGGSRFTVEELRSVTPSKTKKGEEE